MKISAKSRYGLRVILDIALREQEEPVTIKDIARRQQIPRSYLEQMVAPLAVANILKTKRGPKGGLMLARPPRDITMSEIVTVFEGSITPVECVENPELCPRYNSCSTWDLWNEMNTAMNDVLKSITLETLVERQKRKESHKEEMYYI